MHQHIACRLQDVGLVQLQLQPTRRRNRAGCRNSTLIESVDQSEQCRTSGRLVWESAETSGFTETGTLMAAMTAARDPRCAVRL